MTTSKSKSIACPVVDQVFPADTVDPGFTISVVGTLADGTAFSDSKVSSTLPLAYDFQPGTFQVIVSKLGVASQPSALFTVPVAATLAISVPDATQAATVA